MDLQPLEVLSVQTIGERQLQDDQVVRCPLTNNLMVCTPWALDAAWITIKVTM